jgi:hypothetical protein
MTLGEKLDALQTETEKLLALLKDREVGVAVWHQFLGERLQAMRKLIEDAIGP